MLAPILRHTDWGHPRRGIQDSPVPARRAMCRPCNVPTATSRPAFPPERPSHRAAMAGCIRSNMTATACRCAGRARRCASSPVRAMTGPTAIRRSPGRPSGCGRCRSRSMARLWFADPMRGGVRCAPRHRPREPWTEEFRLITGAFQPLLQTTDRTLVAPVTTVITRNWNSSALRFPRSGQPSALADCHKEGRASSVELLVPTVSANVIPDSLDKSLALCRRHVSSGLSNTSVQGRLAERSTAFSASTTSRGSA
jgi:hypothetical protein